MPDFETRDPTVPGFWDERFERGFTPWDRGGVPQALRDFVAAQGAPLRTLIPGCGTAHELVYLSEAGWPVDAIDFSSAAVATAKAAAGPWSARVAQADFFSWQPAQPLALIYERAFLCALPRVMWSKAAARWAELLAPGALLAGYFFFDESLKGPPFGTNAAQLNGLLAEYFVCIEDAEV
ncbi:MAG: methyltransferase domain-containing protein, partial [Massilia sp.]